MVSYILLFILIALIAIGVVRATRHNQRKHRKHYEPHLGDKKLSMEALTPELTEFPEHEFASDDDLSAVRVIESAVQKVEPAQPQATPVSDLPPPATLEVIVLNLFTDPAHPYKGYDLLQVLLTHGMRFGKKNIFHRHVETTGRGAILFSLASAVEPGRFELSRMAAFSSPGLTLFMQPPLVAAPLQAFNCMLSTAQALMKELGGELLDERRQPLTSEKIAGWRSQLQPLSIATHVD